MKTAGPVKKVGMSNWESIIVFAVVLLIVAAILFLLFWPVFQPARPSLPMALIPQDFRAQVAVQAPSLEQTEEWAWKLFDLYNEFRMAKGQLPVEMIKELKTAAIGRAWDEGFHNSFDHIQSDGRRYNYVARDDYGFKGLESVECLAAFPFEWNGEDVPAVIINAWSNSPDHLAAMLWPRIQTAGFAFVWVENSQYGLYVIFLGGYDGNQYAPLTRPVADLKSKVYLPLSLKIEQRDFVLRSAKKELPIGKNLLGFFTLVVLTAIIVFILFRQKRQNRKP